MTREEAIKGLKVLAKDFSGYKPNEEMFDMAIKALKQPECEDAVYRKAVQMLLAYFVPEERYAEAVDGLRRLPSAQPGCEDAVSRFEVLRLIDYSSNDLNDSVDNWYFQGKVKELPSVTPKQPGWIPCKTRKPEKSGLYLVTKQQKTGEIQLATAHYNTAFDEWSGNGNFKKVLAWQPLPLPWKGGQDGD